MIPPELRDALEPSDSEVGRLVDPLAPELLRGLAEATEPRPAELARLRPRERRFALPGWVLVTAALLVAFVVLPRPERPVTLAPGVEVHTYGTYAFETQDEVAVVRLREGLANFRAERPLRVEAGEVDIETDDARFSVLVHRGRVLVDVFDGAARVRDGLETHVVEAGAGWTQPASVAEDEPLAGIDAARVDASPAPLHPHLEPSRPLPRRVDRDELPELSADVKPYHQLLNSKRRLADVEAFLAAHPDSIFRREAEVWRLEALANEVDPGDALVEVDGWLAEHGDSARFADVHMLRATLLRDRLEDCEAAATSYRVVIEVGSPMLARQAGEYLDRCR